jgi:NADH:ubiquinone oxidoreductase subunit 4 (subunit M)
MIYIGTILSEIEPHGLILSTIVISLLCFIITVGKILCVFHKIFYGSIMPKFYREKNSQIIYPKREITKSEIIVLSFIVLAIFLLGIFPNYILEIINSKSDIIIDFLKV